MARQHSADSIDPIRREGRDDRNDRNERDGRPDVSIDIEATVPRAPDCLAKRSAR